MSRNELTPCILCSKSISYLWEDTDPMPVPDSIEIDGACRVVISAGVGSSISLGNFNGVVCDDCVQSMVADGKIR